LPEQRRHDVRDAVLRDARTGSGELEFCNAGHNAPYRLNGQGLEVIEGAKGIILGVRPDAVYTTGRTSLAPGESIYVFTDASPRRPTSRESCSRKRVWKPAARRWRLLDRGRGSSHRSQKRSAASSAMRFPSDDITMLAVHRLDGAAL